jgi:hypothetical protein
MKKITAILFVSFFTLSMAMAQPRGGNPKFDASANPYEKILKDTATGKRTARFIMNFLPTEVLRDYFNASPCNEYAELSNTRITQFNDFVQQFLSGSSDPKQMKKAEEDFKKKGTASFAADIDYHLGFIEKQGTFTSDANIPVENLICRAKGSVQAIKSIINYLEAVKKVFPSTPGVDDVIAKGKQSLSAYPDNKSLLAVIKKNKEGELAEVTFPAPYANNKNPEWEGWFKQYFSKNYPGYTYIKQSLLVADWYVKKNEISGLPEYRQIGTAIGAKAPDGKCKIIKIDLYQDYVGGKYSSSRFDEFSVQEMLCENLK